MKASGSIFHGFWMICWWIFDDFVENFGGAPNSWKCRLDTLLIRFEAHRRFGKEMENVIESDTFPGCGRQGLPEWILGPFLMDFGTIWGAKWTPQVGKQPSKNPAKKCLEKGAARKSGSA